MSRAEQRQFSRRRLRLETLETRRVLAGGVYWQNIIDPEDTDGDGVPSPRDALILVNALNDPPDDDAAPDMSHDVNGDGKLSPIDALYVINRLNSGSKTSAVPIATRIANLENALANGKLPNGFSLEAAKEILATLRNGGRPELGDRYRNGKMMNLKDHPEQLADSPVSSEDSEPTPAPSPSASVGDPLGTDIEAGLFEDPLDLEVGLEEDSPQSVDWWNDVVEDLSALKDGEADVYVRPLLVEGLKGISNDTSLREWLDHERIDRWITALENNELVPHDILLEMAAYTATLGDLHEQISQMFANFDVEAIMEYLPNFEIIVEAIAPDYTKTDHDAEYEAALAEWAAAGAFIDPF